MTNILRKLYRCLILLILATSHWQCESHANPTCERLLYSKDTLSSISLGILPNNEFKPDTVVDLRGKTCIIPNDVKIDLRAGGIRNGRLIGNSTRLVCGEDRIDRVKIEGTWIVPIIKTSYFKDLNYVNSLEDVVSLASPKIINNVIIEAGEYYVEAAKEHKSIVRIPSNTKVKFDGVVKLRPNNLEEYDIFLLEGSNITVIGKGEIIGDKSRHTGQKGEWGMGIRVRHAENVQISGVKIKKCWGDCIYLGNKSRKIDIRDCSLSDGRRQGISITDAVDVRIQNCHITNVCGTEPEYGIDIEPNDKCNCDDILISDVAIEDCRGGILAYGRSREARIGMIRVENCRINGTKKVPLRFERCEEVRLKRVKLPVADIKKGMYMVEVENFINK